MNPIFAQENEVMDTSQTAEFLQISTATVKNWIRHNYLMPINPAGKASFSTRAIAIFKENLTNGRIGRLRKRANKDKSAETFLPLEYLSDIEKVRDVNTAVNLISEYGVTLEEGLFFLALNYLYREGLVARISKIDDILTFDKKVFFHKQIRQEIINWSEKISFKSDKNFQSKILTTHIPRVRDFLGVVYQTLSSEGNKSKSGAYYTPLSIVERIVNDHIQSSNLKILDPCCGTGQFLLAALERLMAIGGQTGALRNVWGSDIDDIAVRIARINLIAKCGTLNDISPNIFCQNTLLDNKADLFSQRSPVNENFFDLVITNPPWGAKYSSLELSQLNLLFPDIRSGESFSFFIEKGLRYLKNGGILSYVLPESILNVKIHSDIRKRILNDAAILKIAYLNRVFKNVFTPVVRLDIQNNHPCATNEIAIQNGKDFKVKQRCFRENGHLEFRINIDREDKIIINKIFSQAHHTLAGQADWALGIVTGDNAKYLSGEKLPGYEGILTGKEVSKFVYCSPRQFIKYEPEKFQQVAPEWKYRAKEKLIYRFISKELIFSYDDKQMLTLNSANILIPKIDKYPAKVMLGLFNSSLYQYIFRKKFSSIKVLKGHIETLPLPNLDDEEISNIKKLVDDILIITNDVARRRQLLDEIDHFVMSHWGLTSKEMDFVLKSLRGE